MEIKQQAREMLINENMGLIHGIARKTAGSRTDLTDDLVSIAYMQFIKCMDETFDFKMGTEFSTYVSSCMIKKCQETKIKA